MAVSDNLKSTAIDASGGSGEESAASTVVTAPAAAPLPPRFILKFTIAEFALVASMTAPGIVGLPLRVEHLGPAAKAQNLSLVLGVASVVGLIAFPLAGRFSDRTMSARGRRRPWILGGPLGTAAGVLLAAFVDSIAAVVIGWALVVACFSATQAALYATTVDQVPFHHRSRVTGAIGGAVALAMLVGVSLSQIGDVTVQLVAPPLVAVLLVGNFALTMNDEPRKHRPEKLSFKEFAGSFWTDISAHGDFGWVWISRAAVVLGLEATPAYFAFYLMSRLGLTPAQVPAKVGGLMMIYFLGLLIAVVASGIWSDKLGVRKPFVIASSTAVAVALALLAVAPRLGLIVLGLALLGLAAGMFYAVDLALVTDVLPAADNAGKDFGVMNFSTGIPQVLVPLLATAALGVGGGNNYRLFFGLLAALSVVGALTVTRVKHVR